MKNIFLCCIVSVILFTLEVNAEDNAVIYTLNVEYNSIFDTQIYGINSFQIGSLEFTDNNNEKNICSEVYLIATVGPANEPRIVEPIRGHAFEMKFRYNENKNTPPFLLVFYHAGANSYKLNAYSVESQGLRPLNWNIRSSNFSYIKVDGNFIYVRNTDRIYADKDPVLLEAKYRIIAERIEFISEWEVSAE